MKVLLLVDLINEMVAPEGKLAGKGYAAFAEARDVASAVAAWREHNDIERVIHVGLEFQPDYADAARKSLLLGKAPDFGVATRGEFGAEFVSWATPAGDDLVVKKHRISPFFGTDLAILLSSLDATDIVVGGCATDLAVSSTVRDAHDRDFSVSVAESLCVAAGNDDHEAALLHLRKIATIV